MEVAEDELWRANVAGRGQRGAGEEVEGRLAEGDTRRVKKAAGELGLQSVLAESGSWAGCFFVVCLF